MPACRQTCCARRCSPRALTRRSSAPARRGSRWTEYPATAPPGRGATAIFGAPGTRCPACGTCLPWPTSSVGSLPSTPGPGRPLPTKGVVRLARRVCPAGGGGSAECPSASLSRRAPHWAALRRNAEEAPRTARIGLDLYRLGISAGTTGIFRGSAIPCRKFHPRTIERAAGPRPRRAVLGMPSRLAYRHGP